MSNTNSIKLSWNSLIKVKNNKNQRIFPTRVKSFMKITLTNRFIKAFITVELKKYNEVKIFSIYLKYLK